jgi:pimeloyl-ACP methyl ester carboxylesterase
VAESVSGGGDGGDSGGPGRVLPRGAGLIGAAVGVVAAGTAVGIAVERLTIGRAVRRMARQRDPGEVFGSLRGIPQTVVAPDGVELYVEVDDPYGRPRPLPGRRVALRAVPDPTTTGQRPTLLFTHGFCLPQDCWHYQRIEFSGDYRMVFWDQRGHGRSDRPKPGEELSVDTLGEDLHAVLEATCPTGPVVLVGHSMGGMSVLALAKLYPELFGTRVVGTALLATSGGRFDEAAFGLPKTGAKLFHRAAPSIFDLLAKQRALVERSRRISGDIGLVLTKRYSFGTDVPEAVVRFVKDLIESTPIDVIAQFFPIFKRHDAIAAGEVVGRAPTLVLGAGRDLLLPPEHSEALAEAIPGAEYVQLPEAGHVVILECPDEVNAALRRLVSRAEESAAPDGRPPGGVPRRSRTKRSVQ